MLTSTDLYRASQKGIKETTIRGRISIGWDRERALTEETNKRSEELAYWREVAAENGISRMTFQNRLYNLHWTEERAATEPKGKRGRKSRKGED